MFVLTIADSTPVLKIWLERKEIGTALGFPAILSFYIRRGVNNYTYG
jgi:hypothetical protein